MANKPIEKVIKLQIPAGSATPAPPVGPVLGEVKVNIMDFCKKFNDATKTLEKGMIIPVAITVYVDKSFEFVLKQPPASALLKKAAGAPKGSGEANRNKVGQVSRDQLRKIAQVKMPDLNAADIEGAMRIIEGTARNMGIEIVEG